MFIRGSFPTSKPDYKPILFENSFNKQQNSSEIYSKLVQYQQQQKQLEEQRTPSTASVVFVSFLSTVFGMVTLLSLATICIWWKKNNKIYPMNKSEISDLDSIFDDDYYDNISQSTQLIDNWDSCLSHVRRGIVKKGVSFAKRVKVASYNSIDIRSNISGK